MRILDAGCGEGRNSQYFIRTGYDIWGIDQQSAALRLLRLAGKSLHPDFDPEKFVQADLTDIPFPDHSFDALIACSVLHFASNEDNFRQMMDELFSSAQAIGKFIHSHGYEYRAARSTFGH